MERPLDRENWLLYAEGKLDLEDVFICDNCGERWNPNVYIDCPYCGIHYPCMKREDCDG